MNKAPGNCRSTMKNLTFLSLESWKKRRKWVGLEILKSKWRNRGKLFRNLSKIYKPETKDTLPTGEEKHLKWEQISHQKPWIQEVSAKIFFKCWGIKLLIQNPKSSRPPTPAAKTKSFRIIQENSRRIQENLKRR